MTAISDAGETAHGVAPPWGCVVVVVVVVAAVVPSVPAAGVAEGVGVGVGVALDGARRGRRRRGDGGGVLLEEHDHLEVGALADPARRGVAPLDLGRVAAGDALSASMLGGGLAERDAGDPVDVVQARHQAGDLALLGGAALDRDRGRGDGGAQRAAAAAGVGADVARERLQRDVGGDGAREIAQGLLPVEARAGEILDGLHAGLRHRVEVGVGLELVGLALKRLSALGDLGEVGLALLDGVVDQDVARDACNAGGEHAEDDESARAARGLRAGAELRGGLGGAARVGGKEVDGSHAPGIGTPLERLEPGGAPTLRATRRCRGTSRRSLRPRRDRRGCPGTATGRREALLCGPSGSPRRAMMIPPTTRAGDQRDEDRRDHVAAEEDPHHARELDVAHAHPRG